MQHKGSLPHTQKSATVPLLNQTGPAHVLVANFFNTCFDIILS